MESTIKRQLNRAVDRKDDAFSAVELMKDTFEDMWTTLEAIMLIVADKEMTHDTQIQEIIEALNSFNCDYR